MMLVMTGCGGTPSDGVPPGPPGPWHSRSTTIDLTADGRPDTVRIEAHGSQVDSLRIRLTFVVDGVERHREEWRSSYELALVDLSAGSGTIRDDWLRARLDTVVAGVKVQRFDAPGVRIMAEDSAVLVALDPMPVERISFSYGYETTVRLVWDTARQRFVRLWSCC